MLRLLDDRNRNWFRRRNRLRSRKRLRRWLLHGVRADQLAGRSRRRAALLTVGHGHLRLLHAAVDECLLHVHLRRQHLLLGGDDLTFGSDLTGNGVPNRVLVEAGAARRRRTARVDRCRWRRRTDGPDDLRAWSRAPTNAERRLHGEQVANHRDVKRASSGGGEDGQGEEGDQLGDGHGVDGWWLSTVVETKKKRDDHSESETAAKARNTIECLRASELLVLAVALFMQNLPQLRQPPGDHL